MTTNLQPQAVERVFFYNGRQFPDVSRDMTPDQVRAFYANIHPELTNAAVEPQGFQNGFESYEFRRNVGSKG